MARKKTTPAAVRKLLKEQKKHKRIKALRCKSQIDEMFYAGFPVPHIAKYIQERMGESRDVTRKSMTILLYRYKEDLNKGMMVRASLPRMFNEAEETFSSKLGELQRLENTYRELEYHFDVLAAESRINQTFRSQLLPVAREMRSVVKDMHTIKMDLGLVGSRDLGTLTVSAEKEAFVKDRYGEAAAKAFKEPVSRGRVLAALGAIKRAGLLRDDNGEIRKEMADKLGVAMDDEPMDDGYEDEMEEEEPLVIDVPFEVSEKQKGQDKGGEDDREDGRTDDHIVERFGVEDNGQDDSDRDEEDEEEEEYAPIEDVADPVENMEVREADEKPDMGDEQQGEEEEHVVVKVAASMPPGPAKAGVANKKVWSTDMSGKQNDNND